MSKFYWCKQRMTFVPAEEFQPPASAGPIVMTDTMDAIRSEADGKHYDSKSAYRRGLRAAGCVEVGNEPIHQAPPKQIPDVPGLRDEIRRTWSEMNG